MAVGDIKHLSASQEDIIRAIIRGGRRAAKRHKWGLRDRQKAIETGLAVGYTEARYSNPEGGDRDSGGWRQERRMYYPNPTDLEASIERFYDEYEADADKSAALGVRAQQVQQSGTPHVWDSLGSMAAMLRKKYGGSAGATRGLGGNTGSIRSAVTPTGLSSVSYDPAEERRFNLFETLEQLNEAAGNQDPLVASNAAFLKNLATPTPQVTEIKAPRGRIMQAALGEGASSSTLKGIKIRPDKNKGAKQLAEWATQGIYGSGERTPGQNAAVGGAQGSDHLTTNTSASAVDAKYGTGKQIARKLGIKNWKPGNYDRHTITVDGRVYSVQILEDVEGHYDHTHLGIRRIR